MIRKQSIIDCAAEWRLRPDVVEKDYALGWLLATVAGHPETATRWVFKDGTCLKKCFIETYRFSEDLDFSLLPGAAYSKEELLTVLRGDRGGAFVVTAWHRVPADPGAKY